MKYQRRHMVLKRHECHAHRLQKCGHKVQCSTMEMETLLPGTSGLRKEVTSLLKAAEAWSDMCRVKRGPEAGLLVQGSKAECVQAVLQAFTVLSSVPSACGTASTPLCGGRDHGTWAVIPPLVLPLMCCWLCFSSSFT